MKKYILSILALVFLGFIIYQSSSSWSENKKKASAKPTKVVVQIAKESQWQKETSFSGRVQYSQQATLAAQVGGVVAGFELNQGDSVRKGQFLARIKADELWARQKQADIALKMGEEEERLMRRKWDDLKPEQRAQFKLQSEQLRAARAENLAYLAKANLRAPFAGFLANKLVHSGDVVTVGQPLATVVGDKSKKEVQWEVAGSEAGDLQISEKLYLEKDGKKVEISVFAISPSPNQHSQKLLVRAKFLDLTEAEKLNAGDFVEVVWQQGEFQVGAELPATAVVRKYSDQFVFLEQAGKAVAQKVEPVAEKEAKVLLKGIPAGSKVIISNVHTLKDGDLVQVAENN